MDKVASRRIEDQVPNLSLMSEPAELAAMIWIMKGALVGARLEKFHGSENIKPE
jgi:hypothetical protein